MRVLVILAMILASGASAWIAWVFFRAKEWAAVFLFVTISILTMSLLVGGFFGWIGG